MISYNNNNNKNLTKLSKMVKFFDVRYSRNYTKSTKAGTEIHEKPRANLKTILFSSKLNPIKSKHDRFFLTLLQLSPILQSLRSQFLLQLNSLPGAHRRADLSLPLSHSHGRLVRVRRQGPSFLRSRGTQIFHSIFLDFFYEICQKKD